MKALATCVQQPSVTVPLLKPGHFKQEYPITTFFENKRFSIFFANRPINFKVNNAAVENFKTVELT